ncbi:MAG: hypothetical protein AAF939_13575 [Planctomycetota bacterium]
MLQSYQDGFHPDFSVVNFVENDSANPILEQPHRDSQKFLDLFEKITGWKPEFEETLESFKHRQAAGLESVSPRGSFTITDMSDSWPAHKATGHRGFCDEFMECFGNLVAELQETQMELEQVKSALSAFSTEPVLDSRTVISDSFAPSSYGHDDFEVVKFPKAASIAESDSDQDFELVQDLGYGTLVPIPFSGWSMGGSTGLIDQKYLDWKIDSQERISISVGLIGLHAVEDDLERTIRIEPLTSEFLVDGDGLPLTFYRWSQGSETLTDVGSMAGLDWLYSGDAIIASIHPIDGDHVSEILETSQNNTADQIARKIQVGLEHRWPVLILVKN